MFSDKLTFVGGGDILVPGTPFGGGYYAGKINIGGSIYALVVAPASLGGQSVLQWKTSQTQTPWTNSLNDGWANTQAMIDAGIALHPAAQFCKNLTIGGHTDWYLPSVNELEIAYRNLKPSTTKNNTNASGRPNGANGYNPDSVPVGAAYTSDSPARTNVMAFITGGTEAFFTSNYWSSTAYAPGPEAAWSPSFYKGDQLFYGKSNTHYVRGFRRVLIS